MLIVENSYHIVYKSHQKKKDVCDVCGGELTQRSDESEEAVQVRIDTYNKQTKPLIDYYTMLVNLLMLMEINQWMKLLKKFIKY